MARQQPRVENQGGRREDRRVPLERRDDARIRRERHRPDDSDVVVMLLDRSGSMRANFR